jgi:hypothetical protein
MWWHKNTFKIWQGFEKQIWISNKIFIVLFLECFLLMNFYHKIIIIVVDYALVSKGLTMMVCQEAILTLFQYWPSGDLR